MINIKQIKRYCKDFKNIENYDLAINDTTQVWHCHHRLETNFSDGTLRPGNAQLKMPELKALGMYYNRSAKELIFLTLEDHKKMHRTTGCIGTKEENTKTYLKSYDKVRNSSDKRKEDVKKNHKKYDSSEKGKRNSKVRGWAKNNNLPDPAIAKFPNKWSEEDKAQYIIYYNNKKGVKVEC